ncbi:major facilitator superfamily domain-containing protein [Trichophaea hybrida]|nr:major facilitator superfamily domain-containing protein [Trichophaea hybrida]
MKRVISFTPGDSENPYNWSTKKKWFIITTGIIAVTNSTFASSLPSGAMLIIQQGLNVMHTEVTILTISFFLLGYVVGPIDFAPFSGFYGRRSVSIIAFEWFVVGTICCAVNPNIASLLMFRFLAGVGASAPMSVTCSDDVIISGLSFIPLLFCPETFASVLLLRKAQRIRAQGDAEVIAPLELEDRSLKSALKTTLARPFRMFWNESIVLLVSLYLSLIYGAFYLFFQSYPIIYQGIYGFGPGISGLHFILVGLGASFSFVGVILWDRHINRRGPQNNL